MLNVLICDEKEERGLSLRKMIEKETDRKQFAIRNCTKEEYREKTEKEKYDLVLVNICAGGVKQNLAFLREDDRQQPLEKIIFTGNFSDTVLEELFLEVQPYGILREPVHKERCIRLLKKAAEEKRDGESIVLRLCHGKIRTLPTKEIYYFESNKRIVTVYFRNGEARCYEKLDHLQERLPENFVRCHKSFLVNMDRITGFEKHRIFMTDGKCADISRRRIQEVKRQYFQYMGMEERIGQKERF